MLAIGSLIGGLLAVWAAPAQAAAPLLPNAAPTLDSCAAVHQLVPFAPDGNYLLLANNTLLSVYCHDMAGTPKEYITLANTGGDANFSQYTAGGASPGTSVRTSFTKLRIDPATLTVDINDLTFATSTGRLQHSSVTRGPSSPFVTQLAYGTGMTCANPGTPPNGPGNIDLTGTPFALNDTFAVSSFAGTGSATISPDNKTANLLVSGYCGWIQPAPAGATPYDLGAPRPQLNLTCAPFNPLDLFRLQACIKL
jgi:hypothetical protein